MPVPQLSILDPSPVFEGRTASDAFQETRALAVAADKLGYRSYWVQEHHNSPSFAGTAPEILIADLASRTSNIRLGSGGVMLPNYSPLKVAEQFAALSTLYPDRIELGLGRATGADPRASAALLGPGTQEFPQMLNLLLGWLLDTSGERGIPPGHPAHGIYANPQGARPDVWMLSSSPQSAAFAGAMGLKLAFADFLSPGGAGAAIAAYRQSFKPSAFASAPHAAVGLVVLAAETSEEAERLSATLRAWSIGLSFRQGAPFQNVDKAVETLQRADPTIVSATEGRAIIGDVSTVCEQLKTVATHTKADEFFVLTIAETTEARLRSYELIIDAFT
ncbi:MAG: LLM class flavin-dependent oxidoreductase [Pseudomonadota bacterium]